MATTAPSKVATITGTFLTPGVSSNGRLYTREAIGKAVTRMQAAISDGNAPPITQLTSHGTDDVLQTVGRITKAWQDPNTGHAKFESEIPPTTAGRDLAALAKHGYAQAVSISGRWIGAVRTEEHEGEEVETADDMDVARIDYVPRGGVSGARIDSVALAEGAPLGDFRDEFTSAVKVLDEDVQYADPGFREDGQRRYRLDTKANAQQAWSYLNQPTVIEKYKPADLQVVRENVTQALRGFGVKPAQETAGDGAESKPKGNAMSEETKTEEVKEGISDADVAKIGAALVPALAEAIKAALKPVEEAAPVTESAPAPAATETVEEQVQKLLESQKAQFVAAVVKEYGLPPRTGIVRGEGEAKPLHEMSREELKEGIKAFALDAIHPEVNPRA